jgi:hypothetical protein
MLGLSVTAGKRTSITNRIYTSPNEVNLKLEDAGIVMTTAENWKRRSMLPV